MIMTMREVLLEGWVSSKSSTVLPKTVVDAALAGIDAALHSESLVYDAGKHRDLVFLVGVHLSGKCYESSTIRKYFSHLLQEVDSTEKTMHNDITLAQFDRLTEGWLSTCNTTDKGEYYGTQKEIAEHHLQQLRSWAFDEDLAKIARRKQYLELKREFEGE